MATAAGIQIRRMLLADLNPSSYNPRDRLVPGSDQYDNLSRSIASFGYVDPLVWNERTGNLVGGHQRYWILIDDGYEEADVSVVDLDLDHEKALNVLLNNPKAQGEYNLTRLTDLLNSLEPDIAAMTGFIEADLAEMARQAEITDPTIFLDGIDGDAPLPGIGAPELMDDHPHRTGQQYFQFQLVFTAEQREFYFRAISRAKALNNLDTTMEALVAVCEYYLDESS